MIFCRHCGKQIHEEAPRCPQCGGVQQVSSAALATPGEGGSPWMAITSLVLGVLCALALLEGAEHDKDAQVGMGMFAMASLALGVISLSGKKPGKGMAIAGVVLSSFSLLALLGSL